MKKTFILFLLSVIALPFVNAEDWGAVPSGKARIVVYGDFMALDIGEFQAKVDDEKAFPVKISQTNLVLDLAPGRHYLTFSYTFLGNAYSELAGFFLVDGNIGYLQYYVSGDANWIHLVTPEKFLRSVKNRPASTDPFAGGNS